MTTTTKITNETIDGRNITCYDYGNLRVKITDLNAPDLEMYRIEAFMDKGMTLGVTHWNETANAWLYSGTYGSRDNQTAFVAFEDVVAHCRDLVSKNASRKARQRRR